MGLLQEYENQYSILSAEITSCIGKLSVSAIGKQIKDEMIENNAKLNN